MKKLWFLLLPIAIVAALFIPYTVEKKVTVKDKMLAVSAQTTQPGNIAKWYLPFGKVDPEVSDSAISMENYGLTFRLRDPMSTIVTAKREGKEKLFLWEVMAGQEKNNTDVLLSYNSNFWQKMTGSEPMVKDAEESLNNLKAYMEIAEVRYGFEIKTTLIKDTTFLVSSSDVDSSALQEKSNEIFDLLIAFSEKNGGGFTGVKIFNKRKLPTGGYKITGAIGVTKVFANDAAENIKFERMPYNKKLLYVDYTGTYGKVEESYAALEQFSKDNQLVIVAMPYEKWGEGPVTMGPEDLVRLEVYLPVL